MRLPALPNEHPSPSPGKKYAVEREYVRLPLPLAGHVSPWAVCQLRGRVSCKPVVILFQITRRVLSSTDLLRHFQYSVNGLCQWLIAIIMFQIQVDEITAGCLL